MQHPADPTSDSEYEYEYDETETETFYVNIDLTSYNGPLRQPRRGASSATTTGATGATAPTDDAEAAQAPSPADAEVVPADEEDDDDNDNDDDAASEAEDLENTQRLQIMELHGKNPFVSYRNHIFSCEWADMIGTDMHFASRDEKDASEAADPTFAKHADDYSLIATNGIKIMGRRARLTGRAAAAASREQVNGEGAPPPPQQQQQPEAGSAQVRFMQEMMDIKQERGETDMLQMTFGTRRGKNFEDRIGRWASNEQRRNMIHQLNRAALGGDQNALARLEELYAQIEAGADVAESSSANASETVPLG